MAAVQFTIPYDIMVKPTNLGTPNGKLYVYAAGGLTLRPVYASSSLTTQLSNPVIADGAGRLPAIYLDNALSYRIRAYDKNDALLIDRDPYIPGAAPDSAALAPYQAAAEAAATASAGSASTSTTQAGIATGAAGTATTEAGFATTQAGISTAAAATSTTQAGVSTAAAALSSSSYAAIAAAIGSGSLNNATVNAATRSILKGLNTVLALPAQFDGSTWEIVAYSGVTAHVAADTVEGIYARSTYDTSKVWVRRFSGPLDIRWFGAVGDCTAYGVGTDNSPAINGAKAIAKLIGNGAAILIPKTLAAYRCASTINFTEHVQLIGQGYSENPGLVGGTSYTAPNGYRGSVLVFDAGVAGLQFTAFTDHAANAVAYQYESSSYSVARDLWIISGGGTGTTAHGADIHVGVRFDNVRITGFAGNGLNIVCNTAGANQYGNADESLFSNIFCNANKLHGVLLSGNDANNITFTACRFTNNGGCGSLDFTVVGGNLFQGCQYATNNQSVADDGVSLRSGWSAAQRTQVLADAPALSDQNTGSALQYRGAVYDNSDIGNASVYIGCYVEVGQGIKARLRANTHVIGGFLSQAGARHTDYTANTLSAGVELRGFTDFYNDNTANFNFYNAGLNIARASGSAVPKLTLTPATATYSQIAMLGAAGSASAGLDILAGAAAAYFSADAIRLRNAATSTTFLDASAAGVLASVPLGYATGAGGTSTQATSKSTAAAALNKVCGEVTMNSASLAAGTIVSFTMANSKVGATDIVDVNHVSGGTIGAYTVNAVASAGTITFYVRNNTAGALAEALVLRFAKFNAVTA